jgi:2-keto-4-pentenoate hydratase
MREKTKVFLAILSTALLSFAPAAAQAACPEDAAVRERAASYLAGEPFADYGVELSLEDAYCAQGKFIAALGNQLGPVMGYKIAFTSRPLQQRFKVPGPAQGKLFARMFRNSGVSLPRDFAPRPFVEPDLLVTVKDEGIMEATNELEVAEHLAELYAFIELPSIPLAEGSAVTGTNLIAFNAGARLAVLGDGIEVNGGAEFVDALAEMETLFVDSEGKVLQQAKGAALMGHPLRALLWLIADLKERGESLKPGQAISLGALGGLFPVEAKSYILTYRGLPGRPLSVSVSFR